jgi:hypothetical protein
MTTDKKHRIAPLAAMLVLATAGCASSELGPADPDGGTRPPTEGHAYLQIVGDKSVFIGNSAQKELVVKYVDDGGDALAGTVSFAVKGSGGGAALSQTSGVTGGDGSVHIWVTGGASGEASFNVEASAQYATAVDWNVAVKTSISPPPGPLQVIGTYQLESEFNLVSGIPGTAGDVVRAVIAMTDDPNDPSSWLLDQIAGTGSTAKSALDTVRPALDSILNGLIAQASGDIVIDGVHLDIVAFFKKIGNDFGDASQKFGLKSTFQIYAGPGSTLLAKHTITGVFFKIDGKRTDKTLAELDMDNIVVDKVPVTMVSESQITIGDHDIGLDYGALITFALDNIIIPAIDSTAGSVRELLLDVVPCDDVGSWIADNTGIGSEGVWSSLCQTAIAAGASYLEGKLGELGGQATDFKIHGTARPVDSNTDRKVDSFVGGLWEGQLMFAGQPSALAKPMQTFTATRTGN